MILPERFAVPPVRGFCTAIELWAHRITPYLNRYYDFSIHSIAHPTLAAGVRDGVRYEYYHPNTLDRRFYPWLYRIARRIGSRRSYWQSTNYYRSYARKIGRSIRRLGVEIVHLHNIAQFAPWIRRESPDTKIVLDMKWHGLAERGRYYNYDVLDDETAEACLAAVDHVVTTSRYLVEAISARFPFLVDRVSYVPCGVDAEVFRPAPEGPRSRRDGRFRIVHAGRFTPEKGARDLLEAFATLSREHPRAQLRLVGEFWGPGEQPSGFRRQVHERCRELGERVELLGWMDTEEFARELSEADVFVHPAEWKEPFSMVILEAMSVATPVVATATGGTLEQIEHGVHGLLVPPRSPAAIAAAIRSLIADPALGERLGRNARERAIREFRWDQVVDHLRPIYDRLLG